jgi:hypothetical protein
MASCAKTDKFPDASKKIDGFHSLLIAKPVVTKQYAWLVGANSPLL